MSATHKAGIIVLLLLGLSFGVFSFAHAAQDDADKMCPQPDANYKYGGRAKGLTYQENGLTIKNLSWQECWDEVDIGGGKKEIAAIGFCYFDGKPKCAAVKCAGTSCKKPGVLVKPMDQPPKPPEIPNLPTPPKGGGSDNPPSPTAPSQDNGSLMCRAFNFGCSSPDQSGTPPADPNQAPSGKGIAEWLRETSLSATKDPSQEPLNPYDAWTGARAAIKDFLSLTPSSPVSDQGSSGFDPVTGRSVQGQTTGFGAPANFPEESPTSFYDQPGFFESAWDATKTAWGVTVETAKDIGNWLEGSTNREFAARDNPQPIDIGLGGPDNPDAVQTGAFDQEGVSPLAVTSPESSDLAKQAGIDDIGRIVSTPDATPTSIAGGSPYLANQRAAIMAELDTNPALREKVAAVIAKEVAGGGPGSQAVLESMANRALMRGYTSLDQAINDGFYGPVNRGEVDAYLRRGVSAADRAVADEAIAAVTGGSNVCNFCTDQGRSNEIRGPKWQIGGEYFGYLNADPKWSNQQRQSQIAYDSTNPGPAVALVDPGTQGSGGVVPPAAYTTPDENMAQPDASPAQQFSWYKPWTWFGGSQQPIDEFPEAATESGRPSVPTPLTPAPIAYTLADPNMVGDSETVSTQKFSLLDSSWWRSALEDAQRANDARNAQAPLNIFGVATPVDPFPADATDLVRGPATPVAPTPSAFTPEDPNMSFEQSPTQPTVFQNIANWFADTSRFATQETPPVDVFGVNTPVPLDSTDPNMGEFSAPTYDPVTGQRTDLAPGPDQFPAEATDIDSSIPTSPLQYITQPEEKGPGYNIGGLGGGESPPAGVADAGPDGSLIARTLAGEAGEPGSTPFNTSPSAISTDIGKYGVEGVTKYMRDQGLLPNLSTQGNAQVDDAVREGLKQNLGTARQLTGLQNPVDSKGDIRFSNKPPDLTALSNPEFLQSVEQIVNSRERVLKNELGGSPGVSDFVRNLGAATQPPAPTTAEPASNPQPGFWSGVADWFAGTSQSATQGTTEQPYDLFGFNDVLSSTAAAKESPLPEQGTPVGLLSQDTQSATLAAPQSLSSELASTQNALSVMERELKNPDVPATKESRAAQNEGIKAGLEAAEELRSMGKTELAKQVENKVKQLQAFRAQADSLRSRGDALKTTFNPLPFSSSWTQKRQLEAERAQLIATGWIQYRSAARIIGEAQAAVKLGAPKTVTQ